MRFRGCICAIQYRGKEYRLATYLGVRVRICTEERILLTPGRYCLDIRIKKGRGHGLQAPQDGKMSRTIRERASCPAEFRFYEKGIPVFSLSSDHASFEWESGEKSGS